MISKKTKYNFNFILLLLLLLFCCKDLHAFVQGEYKYHNNNTRQLESDSALDNVSGGDALETVNKVLEFLPLAGTILKPMQYMVRVGVINGKSSESNFSGLSSISNIAMLGGTIADIFNPTGSEGASSIAMQEVFLTNLYCKQQLVYVEESEYVSKQKSTPDGGYPIFPIYPMDIPINDKGQCEVNDKVIDTYFKSLGDGLAPINTKCAYSYSATRDQCILEVDIPLFLEFLLQEIFSDTICTGVSYKEAAKLKELEAKKEKVGRIRKVANKLKQLNKYDLAQDGLNLFFDSKLAFEPIMMTAIYKIQFTIDLLPTLIPDLLSGNYACLLTRLSAMTIMDYIAKITIAGVEDAKYGKAKSALKNITFCGYDWLSYKKTNDEKYYFKGINPNSRYKMVTDCINGEDAKDNECNEIKDKACENICENNDKNNKCSKNTPYSSFCNNIKKTDKNIKNKIFREYTYGGKEYKADIVEDDVTSFSDNRMEAMDYDKEYCIDPRLPKYKGFTSVMQRYYMKGNDKGNYACNRFFYNNNDGCMLLEKNIAEDDKKSLEYVIEDGKKYYFINKTEYIEKYSNVCKETFVKARKCCRYRSKHLFCLENKSNTNNKFCFSNVVNSYGSENLKTSLFTYLLTLNKDSEKVTCKIDGYHFEGSKKTDTDHICVFSDKLCPYNFKLNAGLNYRASYCDADYFTDYRDSDSVLQRGNSQYNAADCKEGLFSAKKRAEYKELHSNVGKVFAAYTYDKVRKDMTSFNYNNNDFETIYDLKRLVPYDKASLENNEIKTTYTQDELTKIKLYGFSSIDDKTTGFNNTNIVVDYSLPIELANQIKTSAYGQIKNFCQYRAHCVEVDRESEYPEDFSLSSLFLDSSCNGTSQNSRNILQSDKGGVPRQLSVPIVECVFESLKNLINGIAGMSSCKNDYELNSSGYCDTDSKSIIEEKLRIGDTEYLEERYNSVGNSYVIKGLELPDDYNPFLKMQKYFVNIIKISLCLMLVVTSYRQLITGEFDIFRGFISKNMPKYVLLFAKFSIVSYLIFSNGWQKGAYDYLVNFSTASYSFINNLFIKVAKNPNNQILNTKDEIVLKVVAIDDISNSETDTQICYKYDIFNNIDYSLYPFCEGYRTVSFITINLKDKIDSELKISNNQEISKLLYFIDTYNKNNSNRLELQLKQGDNWINDLSAGGSGGLWNKNYDGCYFDTTEYEDNKQYLSFFDTIDCKMIRYLGYSTNSGAPNLLIYTAIMLVPQYFFPSGKIANVISSIGSMVFGLMLTFLFTMINVIIKAVHMFVSSFFILSILIFLSPIVLPMMFFNKTKGIYDKWFEYILGTTLKPGFGLALFILYMNMMDIMLIGEDVNFEKHSNIGRGANVVCQSSSLSFLCLINKNPAKAYEFLVIIFGGKLLELLMSILIVFLFFKLIDSFLGELNSIIGGIFKIGSTPNSLKFEANIVGEGMKKAMRYGKKIEETRNNYIAKPAVGVMEGGLITKALDKAVSYTSENKVDKKEEELRERKAKLMKDAKEKGFKIDRKVHDKNGIATAEDLRRIQNKLNSNKVDEVEKGLEEAREIGLSVEDNSVFSKIDKGSGYYEDINNNDKDAIDFEYALRRDLEEIDEKLGKIESIKSTRKGKLNKKLSSMIETHARHKNERTNLEDMIYGKTVAKVKSMASNKDGIHYKFKNATANRISDYFNNVYAKRAQLQSEKKEKLKKVEELKKLTVDSISEEVKNAETKLINIQKEVARAQIFLKKMEEEVKNAVDTLSHMDDSNPEYQNQLKKVEEARENVEKALKVKEQKEQEVKVKAEEQEAKLKKLKAKLKEAENRDEEENKKIEKDLKKAEEEFDDANIELEEFQRHIDERRNNRDIKLDKEIKISKQNQETDNDDND